jgi:hypothetical protein
MKQPDEFDAFYKSARTRLLLQTYALTGDLPASRAAVRDSFVVTWHHWRKVSRLADPESWVRPHAWAQAQRRHTTRIWHRDRNLDPEAARTLESLGKLSVGQRKALLLETLTTLPLADRARELGLTRQEAERQTRAAVEGFAALREVEPAALPRLFETLHGQVEDSTWPRASILRRSGAARRRTHTLVGAVAALAVLVGTGFVVDGSNGPTRLPQAGLDAGRSVNAEAEEPAQFDADALVGEDEIGLAVDGTGWRATRTSDNREGDGLATPCQERRYADPRARAALVRSFTTSPARGEPQVAAVQTAELSDSVKAAKRTWDQSLAWYAGCTAPQVQLGTTMRVADVGDEAMLVQLRDWSKGRTYLAGVARTGRITTTTFYRTDDNAEPDVAGATRMLVLAVNGMCPTPQGDGCATTPRTEEVAPVPVGEVPGLLASVDLPMVPQVDRPWVGTEAREARDNVAATTCDRTDFAVDPVRDNVTRTFLIPDARLPAAFGVTETAGTLPSEARARDFVATVRRKMDSCSDRDLGADVTALGSTSDKSGEHALWRVTVEITDQQSVTYLMGVVRRGGTVAQLGFIPGRDITIGPEPFEELLLRAGERLPYLPRR